MSKNIRNDKVSEGNSNEVLELVSRGYDKVVVKKGFGKTQRFKESIEKQEKYKDIEHGLVRISAAPITSKKHGKGFMEIEMPYINGMSGRVIIENNDLNSIRVLNSSLEKIIKLELSNSKEVKFQYSSFKMKIEEVASKDKTGYVLEHREMINEVIECARNMPSLEGPCHGDLSLPNLILNGDYTIVLIDFLKSFVESPLQDAAKYLQERSHYWTLRDISKEQQVRGRLAMKNIYPDPYRIIDKKFHQAIAAFEITTLIRIAPYIKDDITADWLGASINRFKEKFYE
jgi:thiamine kinase-like enzyme